MNKGYKRRRKENEATTESSSDSDIEISILQDGKKNGTDKYYKKEKECEKGIRNDSTDSTICTNATNGDDDEPTTKKCKIEKEEHLEKPLEEQPVHLQIRYKLKKANGYKPDLSALPKAEEEEFFKPWMHYSEEEKQKLMNLTPAVFEHRVGPNVSPEEARKAQKATLNKMLARSLGKRRK